MASPDSVDDFLEQLASAAPTPGGGSAAAIMGAMGAALVSMVCNVTLGKQGQQQAAAEMLAVRTESEKLRVRLTAIVDEDIAAFDGLMAAYKLPKAGEDDQARRAAAIQAALHRATEVPLECTRACAAVIALAARAAAQGYRSVISDAGAGAFAAHAALRSAALNVHINAPALKDTEFARRSVAEVEALAAASAVAGEAVYTLVRRRLEA
jgi:formiminotetrahydrofolate cyclodeaminase